jgi:PST family polysaccharide transporter
MTEPKENASRGLIRSMLVIGSSQVVNIALSIARMKVLAVLLGSSGVGLLSIYKSLQDMVTNAAGLGMGSSGVREIASARGDGETLSRVRRVLLVAHLMQGTLAMLAVWFLRARISTWLLGDETRSTEVGLVGVVILLALFSSAQTALLQGLRRIGDLGRVTVVGAAASTVVGLFAVWIWREAGLIWFLLAQPLATVLVAFYFTRKLPNEPSEPLDACGIWQIWKPMAQLGLAFMLGRLATTATLLVVRGRITQELDLEAAGYFAASWGITMTYVGFLLGAMSADYYPRLTEVIHDRTAAIQLMNDQAQLGLAIGGPVILMMIGWAPWVITLLYSDEFGPAVVLLQWQTVGNVFKLSSWALSYSLVAAARAKTFFAMELSFNIVFVVLVLAFLPQFGLLITAIAFLLGYVFYLTTSYLITRRVHGFRWQPLSLLLLGLHTGLSFALLALARTIPLAAQIIAPILAVATGLFGLRVVLIKIGTAGRLTSRLARIYDVIRWPIRSDT